MMQFCEKRGFVTTPDFRYGFCAGYVFGALTIFVAVIILIVLVNIL